MVKDLICSYKNGVFSSVEELMHIVECEVRKGNRELLNRWRGRYTSYPYGYIEECIFTIKYMRRKEKIFSSREVLNILKGYNTIDFNVLIEKSVELGLSLEGTVDFYIKNAFEYILSDIQLCCEYAPFIESCNVNQGRYLPFEYTHVSELLGYVLESIFYKDECRSDEYFLKNKLWSLSHLNRRYVCEVLRKNKKFMEYCDRIDKHDYYALYRQCIKQIKSYPSC